MILRTLAEAEEYLQGFVNRERVAGFDYERHGLERIRTLLAAVGNPQRGFPCIHITGSKGKGTVALAAGHLLAAAGEPCGVFTSPHLESWLDRFRLGGEVIDAHTLVQALERLRPAVEQQRLDPELAPSFFDLTTALAFEIFRARGAAAGVLEVGIGGRLDSTTICEPRVCAITAVQLEHTQVLGGTLEAIAREKAGIMKPGVPLLHGPLPAEAMAALLARSAALDVELEEVAASDIKLSSAGTSFRLPDGRAARARALGAHQATNLALAVRAVERFLGRPLGERELASLEHLPLPARIERIGNLILDVAHTPDSARSLRETLGAVFPDRRFVFAISISRDKDAAGIFLELAPIMRACVICAVEPLRSFAPEELEPLAWAAGIEAVECASDADTALRRVRAALRPDELGVIAGSVFLAGSVRRTLRNRGEAL